MQTILETRDLSIDFGGFTAVNKVSIKAQKGHITGLIGPNGAGKTTLFQLLSGSIAPTSGSVYFKQQPITHLKAEQRFKRGLVRTFQIPHEFHRLTTLENLMMVPASQTGESLWRNWLTPKNVQQIENKVQQKAWQTLEFLEITQVANELAGNLSGGQKKLLELGRAIMSDAQFILLDEIAAGVNPTLLRKLEQKILVLQQQGLSFLLIEHNMEMIYKLCHPIICMCAGKVLLEGDFNSVTNDPRVLDAYLGESPQLVHN